MSDFRLFFFYINLVLVFYVVMHHPFYSMLHYIGDWSSMRIHRHRKKLPAASVGVTEWVFSTCITHCASPDLLLTHSVYFPPTILSFISSCDIILTPPRLPSFPLPGFAGNERPRWIAGGRGGSVGGPGHTCVYYIATRVSPRSVVEEGLSN